LLTTRFKRLFPEAKALFQQFLCGCKVAGVGVCQPEIIENSKVVIVVYPQIVKSRSFGTF
jgi:hypothetical protein